MTVIVFGSINMDIVTQSVQHPRVGETVHGSNVAFYPGGKGANQAVASAKAGTTTHLLGAVGHDPFGQQLIDFLQINAVDVTHIKRVPQSTGLAAINVADDGSNTIVVVAGANAEAVADASFIQTQNKPVGLAQFETPVVEVKQFFNCVHRAGGTTILNPSPFTIIDDDLLKQTDILILNEIEFTAQNGMPANGDYTAIAQALNNFDYRLSCIIVTLGSQGCLIKAGNTVSYIAGIHCTPVDTTGAGDCFAGVFAASVSAGYDYYRAAERANRAASISVTRMGAGPSMPTQDEIDR